MIGMMLGPYRILEKIGEGGMGEVYKAKDTRLDRTVAIKVLPAHVSADPERRARFEREAKTIAQLNHPHICTLHDVGEQAGTAFLVMEHLEGKTLAERLQRGALPLPQALDCATPIADALSAARTQGVIHRDLKPGNVMLTKTGAKLLDFGLAKLKGHGDRPAWVSDSSAVTESESLTGRGTILGTLPYMAPEQLEGKPADARTDVWALGALLYETVTGKRAFQGSSSVSLIGAIMNAEPAPLEALQPLAPPALDHIVRTCLAKDPNERWQTAGEVRRELEWITTQEKGAAAVWKSVRRRPWVLAGASATAGVLVLLVALVGFNVTGLRDRLTGRGRSETFTSIAVLPLANLTGRADQQAQVDGITELIGTELGTMGALTVKAGPSALEPTWALPHARLAFEFIQAAIGGFIYPPGEAYTEARRHAEEALRLDASLAEAHSAMALVKHLADWDWEQAEVLYTRSIDLNPSATASRTWYGWYLLAAHRFEEGLDQFARAREVDPLGVVVNWEWAYYSVGRFDDALAAFRADVAANPRLATEPWLLVWVALAHVGRQDFAAAAQACDTVVRGAAEQEQPGLLAACGFVFASGDARERALDMRRRLEALERQGRLVDPYAWASLEIGLGERDRAFARLDQAWRERSPNLVGLEPDGLLVFSSVRADPRFQDLLRRINHPRQTPGNAQGKKPI